MKAQSHWPIPQKSGFFAVFQDVALEPLAELLPGQAEPEVVCVVACAGLH
jgi:hypothetical protein